jgi:hypothetical protein
MKTQTLVVSAIALTLLGGALIPSKSEAIPMIIGVDEGQWYLSTPSADTTVSANGGKLRLYDLHIAKMVEVTYDNCTRGTKMSSYEWFYTANSGKTNMGKFIITCKLAKDLVSAYGLDEAEETQLEGSRKIYMISTLNITGGKVDKWIRFTNNFKPVRF